MSKTGLTFSIIFLAVTFLLGATESDSELYKSQAGGVVYIQTGVKVLPEYFSDSTALQAFEEKIGQKIVGEYLPVGEGSGFFVDSTGRLLTNSHVVETKNLVKRRQELGTTYANWVQSALAESTLAVDSLRRLKTALYKAITEGPTALRVRVKDRDFYEAKVLAASEPLDLALLSIPLAESDYLLLGTDLDAAIGGDVYSLGYPFGSSITRTTKDLTISFTKGSISALRPDNLRIQHTATINPGNSGGPLLNARGLVLGVNSAEYKNANNTYFAIGATTIRGFLKQNLVTIPESPARTMVLGGSTHQNVLGEYEVSQDLLFNQPQGTKVFLDEVFVGLTPLGLPAPKDTFLLRLESSDSQGSGKVRVLRSLQGSTEVRIPLVPYQGLLHFVDWESGQSLMVDGVPVQKPWEPMALNVGVHRITTTAAGWYYPPMEVTLTKDEKKSVTRARVPTFPVVITSVSQRPPITATKGPTTIVLPPDQEPELPEGEWELSWSENPVIDSGRQTVQIPAKNTLDLTRFFPLGTLVIESWSSEAKLFVDGVPKAYASPGLQLSPGSHDVEILKRGRVGIRKPAVVIKAREKTKLYGNLDLSMTALADPVFWVGATVASLGVGWAGYGWYSHQDSVALAKTRYFEDYVLWKKDAAGNLTWGAVSAGLGLVLTAWGAYLNESLSQDEVSQAPLAR